MKWIQFLWLSFVCSITTQAYAAGFALIENGASGLGNAYAGASAVAEDASTNYFNPAGLSKLNAKQFVFAGHYIAPKTDFTNAGSHKISSFGGGALSGSNDDGGVSAFVPSFFYAQPINADMTFGFGISVPFGLGTEYDEGWVGRYHAVKSEITTINFNPSLSFKVDEKTSVGFGISAQYIEATLSNKMDSAAFCQAKLAVLSGALATACTNAGLTGANVGNSAYDSQQVLNGEDWSWGWNFGFIYDVSDSTHFGMSYRSHIDHKLTGTVDFTVNAGLQAILNGIPSTTFSDTGVSAGIDLPESVSFSLVHAVNPQWKVMADATWTKWERYDKLTVVFNSGQDDSVSSKHYQNSWRYSFGASYIPDSKQTYRFGLAYDESAVRNAVERTAGSPGNDRLWVSLGYGNKLSKAIQFDIGYAHLFIDDTPIDNSHALWGTVTGSFEQSVDILSAQLTWMF